VDGNSPLYSRQKSVAAQSIQNHGQSITLPPRPGYPLKLQRVPGSSAGKRSDDHACREFQA
jgi:hypothetical protein